MKSSKIEGIVLKRINIGEADKLVTLFTLDQGKLTLKARGIRRLNSRRAGSLELFNLIRANVHNGTLGEVQLVNSFPNWKKHLGRVNIAYQLVELVDKLTPDEEAHPDIFQTLVAVFAQIGQLGDDWQDVVEFWFIDILQDLGYWPRGQKFEGDIYQLIEKLTEREFKSPKVLAKIKNGL